MCVHVFADLSLFYFGEGGGDGDGDGVRVMPWQGEENSTARVPIPVFQSFHVCTQTTGTETWGLPGVRPPPPPLPEQSLPSCEADPVTWLAARRGAGVVTAQPRTPSSKARVRPRGQALVYKVTFVRAIGSRGGLRRLFSEGAVVWRICNRSNRRLSQWANLAGHLFAISPSRKDAFLLTLNTVLFRGVPIQFFHSYDNHIAAVLLANSNNKPTSTNLLLLLYFAVGNVKKGLIK